MASRYQNIIKEKNERGDVILGQTYYPKFGDLDDCVYIITSNTDRLDLIAYDFWGDETLWWIINMVNDLPGDSFYPPIGVQLMIPKDNTYIINKFNKENESN